MKNSENNKEYKITPQGSLGILALGSVGIKKWREVVKAKESAKEITKGSTKKTPKK